MLKLKLSWGTFHSAVFFETKLPSFLVHGDSEAWFCYNSFSLSFPFARKPFTKVVTQIFFRKKEKFALFFVCKQRYFKQNTAIWNFFWSKFSAEYGHARNYFLTRGNFNTFDTWIRFAFFKLWLGLSLKPPLMALLWTRWGIFFDQNSELNMDTHDFFFN